MKLNPINEENVQDWLIEKYNFNKDEAKLIAALSDGSPGIAKQLIDENFLDVRNEILDNLSQFEKEGKISIFKRAYNIFTYSDSLKDALNLFLLWFRDILIYKITHNEELIANKDRIEAIKSSIDNYNTFNLLKIINFTEYILAYSYKRLNQQLAIEVLLNKIFNLRQNTLM